MSEIEREIVRAKSIINNPDEPEEKKNKAKLALVWLQIAEKQHQDLTLTQVPKF